MVYVAAIAVNVASQQTTRFASKPPIWALLFWPLAATPGARLGILGFGNVGLVLRVSKLQCFRARRFDQVNIEPAVQWLVIL